MSIIISVNLSIVLFVVLGSNGVICSVDLSSLFQCDINSTLQLFELIKLPTQSSTTGFTSVGEHHFAVSLMDEQRDKKQERLCVYDARYSTLQASTDLNTGSLCRKVNHIRPLLAILSSSPSSSISVQGTCFILLKTAVSIHVQYL